MCNSGHSKSVAIGGVQDQKWFHRSITDGDFVSVVCRKFSSAIKNLCEEVSLADVQLAIDHLLPWVGVFTPRRESFACGDQWGSSVGDFIFLRVLNWF